jgi:hypothetical protein
MNETIYNLVPREVVVPEKEPMYRSKHDPKTPLTGSTFGKISLFFCFVLAFGRNSATSKISGEKGKNI